MKTNLITTSNWRPSAQAGAFLVLHCRAHIYAFIFFAVVPLAASRCADLGRNYCSLIAACRRATSSSIRPRIRGVQKAETDLREDELNVVILMVSSMLPTLGYSMWLAIFSVVYFLHSCQPSSANAVRLSGLECRARDGRLEHIPRLELSMASRTPQQIVLDAIDEGCLCSLYRVEIGIPGRHRSDGPAKVVVCLQDPWLGGIRLLLKDRNTITKTRRNIIHFHEDSGCQTVSLQYQHELELRLKVTASCNVIRNDPPEFKVTFKNPVNCSAFTGLANGDVVPSNQLSFEPGKSVTFECHEGHKLQNPEQWYSVCGHDGKWKQPLPTCVHVDEWCPALTDYSVDNGQVHRPARRAVNSVLRVECTEGYYLHGQPHYVCQEDGTWSFSGHMSSVQCTKQPNCVVANSSDVIVVGGIYLGEFYKVCCRPGTERYACEGQECGQCVSSYCSSPFRTEDPPKCREVEPLWTRLYSNLFHSAIEMNKSIAATERQCGRPTVEGEEQGDRPLFCSRTIRDLRGCFDLAFLLDESTSMNDEMFNNISLPFVRVASHYFNIGENKTHISVLLFHHGSRFLLDQEDNSSAVYRTLHKVPRSGMGDTNIRDALETFTQHVALDLYNGSSADRRQCRKVMFVLSDGDVNRGGSPEAAAAVLKSLDWEIYAIGIGSRDEARTRFDSISSDPLHKFAFTLEYEPRVVNIQSGGARISKRLPDLEKFVKQNIGGDVDYSQCGQNSLSTNVAAKSRQRILGGQEARFGAYPWKVAILSKSDEKVFCSGFLICRGGCTWVVTAAHCFLDRTLRRQVAKEEVLVRFGENNVIVVEGSELTCTVSDIRIHSSYSRHANPSRGDDLAMIRPSCVVELTTRRRCACLPTMDDLPLYEHNKPTEISGWGARNQRGDIPSITLRWVRLLMVKRSMCQKNFVITDKMVCAKGATEGSDSCQGDSGGALLSRRPDGSYVALGVLSYGQIDPDSLDAVCGVDGYYGVYTNVLKYLDWINDMMGTCGRSG